MGGNTWQYRHKAPESDGPSTVIPLSRLCPWTSAETEGNHQRTLGNSAGSYINFFSSGGFVHLSGTNLSNWWQTLTCVVSRTWARQEVAIQCGHEALLVLVGWDNGDVLSVFPRKALRLVLKSLRERVAADSVHQATVNLLPLPGDAK
jgi:hypothetical protein